MRDIEFRGKTFTHVWLYGSLVSSENLPTAIYFEVGKKYKKFDWGAVRPETVGQYTGLKDKNGIKIFEGDIVEYHTTEGDTYRREMIWDGNLLLWTVGGFPYMRLKESGYIQPSTDILEVIGNIPDNPELLEAHNEN